MEHASAAWAKAGRVGVATDEKAHEGPRRRGFGGIGKRKEPVAEIATEQTRRWLGVENIE